MYVEKCWSRRRMCYDWLYCFWKEELQITWGCLQLEKEKLFSTRIKIKFKIYIIKSLCKKIALIKACCYLDCKYLNKIISFFYLIDKNKNIFFNKLKLNYIWRLFDSYFHLFLFPFIIIILLSLSFIFVYLFILIIVIVIVWKYLSNFRVLYHFEMNLLN